jgi:hypothetical protein
MVKMKTLLFLWLASFVVASRDDDIRATQRRRRLGRNKEIKRIDDDTRAPTVSPSVGPVAVPPSNSPSIATAAEAQLAAPVPGTPLSNSLLSPDLFHADSPAATPTTNVSSHNTTAPNDEQLVLLVLSTWFDPEVLQVSLRLYEDDRTLNLEIVMMRYVPDGVAYELSVRDSSAWLSEGPDSIFVKALNRYLNDAFPDVLVVRIEPVTERNGNLPSDLIRPSDVDALSNNDDDDAMLILAVVLSTSVFCCCVGIALLLLPSYCQFRRELREAWSYNETKEHRVLREIGTEHTEE